MEKYVHGSAKQSYLKVVWNKTGQWNDSSCGTNIHWRLVLVNGNRWYSNSIKCYNIMSNGNQVLSNRTFSNYSNHGEFELTSGDMSIRHGDDGKSNIGISLNGWFTSFGNVNGSWDWELDSIPRGGEYSIQPRAAMYSGDLSGTGVDFNPGDNDQYGELEHTALVYVKPQGEIRGIQYRIKKENNNYGSWNNVETVYGTWNNTNGNGCIIRIKNLEQNTKYIIQTRFDKYGNGIWKESDECSLTTRMYPFIAGRQNDANPVQIRIGGTGEPKDVIFTYFVNWYNRPLELKLYINNQLVDTINTNDMSDAFIFIKPENFDKIYKIVNQSKERRSIFYINLES